MPPDPLILAFDTSAAHCAAALLSGDRIIASRTEKMAKGQAERLMPMLEEMLAGQDIAWSDLSALGVGTGPGNFTGIRISVSAARGLALALGIPAIGVSWFEAELAESVPDVPILVCLPAPRDMIYAQLWSAAAHPLSPRQIDPAAPDLNPDERKATAYGPAAAGLSAHIPIADRRMTLAPLAERIARIAATRISAPDLPRPSPVYVRPADAAPSSVPPPVILP